MGARGERIVSPGAWALPWEARPQAVYNWRAVRACCMLASTCSTIKDTVGLCSLLGTPGLGMDSCLHAYLPVGLLANLSVDCARTCPQLI